MWPSGSRPSICQTRLHHQSLGPNIRLAYLDQDRAFALPVLQRPDDLVDHSQMVGPVFKLGFHVGKIGRAVVQALGKNAYRVPCHDGAGAEERLAIAVTSLTVTVVYATTVAVWGASCRVDISPERAPGARIRATRTVPLNTSTVPSIRT